MPAFGVCPGFCRNWCRRQTLRPGDAEMTSTIETVKYFSIGKTVFEMFGSCERTAEVRVLGSLRVGRMQCLPKRLHEVIDGDLGRGGKAVHDATDVPVLHSNCL